MCRNEFSIAEEHFKIMNPSWECEVSIVISNRSPVTCVCSDFIVLQQFEESLFILSVICIDVVNLKLNEKHNYNHVEKVNIRKRFCCFSSTPLSLLSYWIWLVSNFDRSILFTFYIICCLAPLLEYFMNTHKWLSLF